MLYTADIGNMRDWRDLHRYVLQFASLIDGTCICVGNICMPRTMSRCLVASGFAHIRIFHVTNCTSCYLCGVYQ